jgi:hypothetical protein
MGKYYYKADFIVKKGKKTKLLERSVKYWKNLINVRPKIDRPSLHFYAPLSSYAAEFSASAVGNTGSRVLREANDWTQKMGLAKPDPSMQ